MQLFAQVQKIIRCEDGPPCIVMFLLPACTERAPMWTKHAKEAGRYPWEEADKLAPKLGAHAVVIASQELSAAERAEPLKGETREKRVSYYRRKCQERWKQRREATAESRIIQFQADLERQKLA